MWRYTYYTSIIQYTDINEISGVSTLFSTSSHRTVSGYRPQNQEIIRLLVVCYLSLPKLINLLLETAAIVSSPPNRDPIFSYIYYYTHPHEDASADTLPNTTFYEWNSTTLKQSIYCVSTAAAARVTEYHTTNIVLYCIIFTHAVHYIA